MEVQLNPRFQSRSSVPSGRPTAKVGPHLLDSDEQRLAPLGSIDEDWNPGLEDHTKGQAIPQLHTDSDLGDVAGLHRGRWRDHLVRVHPSVSLPLVNPRRMVVPTTTIMTAGISEPMAAPSRPPRLVADVMCGRDGADCLGGSRVPDDHDPSPRRPTPGLRRDRNPGLLPVWARQSPETVAPAYPAAGTSADDAGAVRPLRRDLRDGQ